MASLQNPTQIRSINAGKYIEVGDIKGYVNRIEGNTIFIESIDGDKNPIKAYNIKEVFKNQKIEKETKTTTNTTLSGPNQPSNKVKLPKEDKSVYGGKYAEDKSKHAPDEKKIKKFYTEKIIKK